ncbi:hypothetical protein QQX13_12155 [Demequina sp. SYSU T00068]|uniref:hypothetical protein n=1 Tax=Demequina lignilytica TaxID=3051663 RepID=UPI002624CB79|nr:hypothetical protein [Demequina sp. SYSU T00068]MDN4491587.1 hypothetical protein [Demequina sp. SYSU T00068]
MSGTTESGEDLLLDLTIGRYRAQCSDGTVLDFDLNISGAPTVVIEPAPATVPTMVPRQPMTVLWARSTPGPGTPPSEPVMPNRIRTGQRCHVYVWLRESAHEIVTAPVMSIRPDSAVTPCADTDRSAVSWVNVHTTRGLECRMVCVDGTTIDFDLCGPNCSHARITRPATSGGLPREEPPMALLWVMSYPARLAEGIPQLLQVGSTHELFLGAGDLISRIRTPPAASIIRIDHATDPTWHTDPERT